MITDRSLQGIPPMLNVSSDPGLKGDVHEIITWH